MSDYWINDAPTVRGVFGINATRLRLQAKNGENVLTVRSASGYASPDAIVLNPGEDTEEFLTVSSVSGSSITLTGTLVHTHLPGEIVAKLADPATITLTVRDPAGVSTPYTYAAAQVTKDAVGRYSKQITLATVGEWFYRWIATGTVIGGGPEKRMAVRETKF